MKPDVWRLKYPRIVKHEASEQGFTILEVLVALILVSIVATAVAQAFAVHSNLNNMAERRSDAAAAAQRVLDKWRVQDPSTMPTTGSSGPESIVIGSRTFEVLTEFCTTAAYCAAANSRMLRVSVTLNAEEQYAVETVFTQLR